MVDNRGGIVRHGSGLKASHHFLCILFPHPLMSHGSPVWFVLPQPVWRERFPF